MADLVDVTTGAGKFKTLVNALTATELLDILKSPGPFTVLAPTDDAFAHLPEGTLNALLLDLPKLKRILMYHILPGDVRSDDLAQIDEAPTEEGSIVAVAQSNGTATINDAQVIQTDLLADNGVVHVIDAVLIPAMLENNL
ncbi:MAG: fasciclin domain-containing protein [Elainellaceae cyanobacterium]